MPGGRASQKRTMRLVAGKKRDGGGCKIRDTGDAGCRALVCCSSDYPGR